MEMLEVLCSYVQDGEKVRINLTVVPIFILEPSSTKCERCHTVSLASDVFLVDCSCLVC